jgi:hypothetical protein
MNEAIVCDVNHPRHSTVYFSNGYLLMFETMLQGCTGSYRVLNARNEAWLHCSLRWAVGMARLGAGC